MLKWLRRILLLAGIIYIFMSLGMSSLLDLMPVPESPGPGTMKVRLYRHQTGKIEELPLNEYVTGVVAAEMPASFPAEALKAQAVAARTYVLKRMIGGGLENPQHPGADVCDDHRHAQAWIDREEMKDRWGVINYYRHYYKIRQAVDDTGTEVITYQGELIDPIYHSACGGKTEDSGAVWKYDIPYLKSVACPYEADPHSVQAAGFSLEQAQRALGIDLTALPVSSGDSIIKITGRTATGRVDAVEAGGVELPATLVRERLGLRSTNFSCAYKDDKLVFTTVGYGHGVGMCQYGAKGFAGKGYDYQKILKHYYSGVEIEDLE